MAPDPALMNLYRAIEANQLDRAIEGLRAYLRVKPRQPDAHSLMCLALGRTGDYERALFHAREACKLVPNDANYGVNLANCLVMTGKGREAVTALRRYEAIDPEHPGVMLTLGEALLIEHPAEAAEHAERTLQRLGPVRDAVITRASALLQTARADEAAALLKKAVDTSPDDEELLKRYASTMCYVWDAPHEAIAAAHRRLGEVIESRVLPRHHERPQGADAALGTRPLRLGLLSRDLRTHSVAFFVEPLMEHMDPRAVEVFVYSKAHKEDAVSARMKPHARKWVHMPHASAAAICKAVEADQLDVLLELEGLTGGIDTLTVLAMRPAPVMGSYIGYPETTGVGGTIRIVDDRTDPADSTWFGRERLVRMESCFLCFAPPREEPVPERTADGPITFGSFNAVQKMNRPLVELWAAVMQRVPGSRMVMKARGLEDARVQALIKGWFAGAKVEASRLTFVGWIDKQQDHRALYASVDIALDSYPYHGTTTTCEALWMGIPVVSLQGDRHASRVGGSLLHAAGFGRWAADSHEAFVETAANLAADRAALAEIHQTLRPVMAASALCDGNAAARRFEATVRGAYERWATGNDAPAQRGAGM